MLLLLVYTLSAVSIQLALLASLPTTSSACLLELLELVWIVSLASPIVTCDVLSILELLFCMAGVHGSGRFSL